MNQDFQKIVDSLDEQQKNEKKQTEKDFLHQQQMANTRHSSKKIIDTLNENESKTKNVNVTNDIATKEDIDNVIEQLKENQLATLLGNQKPSIMLASGVEVDDIIEPLNEKISAALDAITNSNSNEKLAKQLDSSFKTFTKELSSFIEENKNILNTIPEELSNAVDRIDVKPVVNVPKAEVRVEQNQIDISPLLDKLSKVESAVKQIKLPTTDNTELMSTVDSVRNAIESLSFPVPNYVLPFKSSDGKATQALLDDDGNVITSSAIKTERYDYLNPTTIYIGQADVGSSESASVWTIFKYDLLSSSNASGKVKYNGIWNNRATETYA